MAEKGPKAPSRMVGTPLSRPSRPRSIDDTIEVESGRCRRRALHPRSPSAQAYNDVDHGAFAKDLPDHVLVADEASDASGIMRKRTWASVRVDQDRLQFQCHLRGQRRRIPRSTPAPTSCQRRVTQPSGAPHPGPFRPFCLPCRRAVGQRGSSPPSCGVVFVKVVRIYQTLPGPLLYSIEYPYGGHPSYPRITTKQKFAHMKFPDTLGTKCPIPNYTQAILVAQTIQQTEYAGVDLSSAFSISSRKSTTPGRLLHDGSQSRPRIDFGGQEGFGYSIGYMYGRGRPSLS